MVTKVVKVGWPGPSVSLLCASPLTKRDVRVTFIFLRAGSAEEKLNILVGEDINCHLRIMIMMFYFTVIHIRRKHPVSKKKLVSKVVRSSCSS